METANKEVREAIEQAKLTYWKVARQIGIHATTLSVWMRTPLTEERKERVEKAIKELSQQTSTPH